MIFKEELEKFQSTHPYETIDVDGIEFEYMLCGNPESSYTCVYLIGGLGLSVCWLSHVIQMEKDYRVLTFEYPMEIKDIETLGRYAVKLLDALHIENPVLIGASFGGFLSQVIACLIPDRVSAVCLYSTCSLSEVSIKELAKQYWSFKPMLGLMKIIPYSWMQKMEISATRKILSTADETEEDKKFVADLFAWAYGQYTKEFDCHLTGLIISPGYMKPITKEQYAQFDSKALLVLPLDDKAFSDTAKRDLEEMLPGAKTVKVKGGHVATLAKTGEYVKVTREFIEECAKKEI